MTFRIATFNAGLAIGVLPNTTERLPRVIAALAALAVDVDVDVLFVQEFWLESHWRALCAGLASKLPHTLRPPPLSATTGSCTAAQLAPLVACATKRCAGLRDEALARCVVRHCASEGLALPPECLNCIASDPSGSLEEITGRCTGASTRPTSSASKAGGLIAYGGSFGTGLLSRAPLVDPDTLVFEATVNARGALHARVDAGALGLVHVFAVHFSPGGGEQVPQVDELAAWTAIKAPRGQPAVLLGDLNTSPGSSLFRVIERAGFREPDFADRRGTFGSGLETGRASDSGWRLDHVLVRDLGPDARVTSRRILDEPITITRDDGRVVTTTLSDHCGLLAEIDAPAWTSRGATGPRHRR